MLRAWMTRANVKTQAQLAEMFDISEPLMSLYLSGDRLPGRTNTIKFEDAAGIPSRAWSLSVDDELVGAGASKAGKRRTNQK